MTGLCVFKGQRIGKSPHRMQPPSALKLTQRIGRWVSNRRNVEPLTFIGDNDNYFVSAKLHTYMHQTLRLLTVPVEDRIRHQLGGSQQNIMLHRGRQQTPVGKS